MLAALFHRGDRAKKCSIYVLLCVQAGAKSPEFVDQGLELAGLFVEFFCGIINHACITALIVQFIHNQMIEKR